MVLQLMDRLLLALSWPSLGCMQYRKKKKRNIELWQVNFPAHLDELDEGSWGRVKKSKHVQPELRKKMGWYVRSKKEK